MGLLHRGGVAVGKFDGFHPAPEGFQAASRDFSSSMDTLGQNVASLALIYAIGRA